MTSCPLMKKDSSIQSFNCTAGCALPSVNSSTAVPFAEIERIAEKNAILTDVINTGFEFCNTTSFVN